MAFPASRALADTPAPDSPQAERLLNQPLNSQAARDSISHLLDAPPFRNRENVTRWRFSDEDEHQESNGSLGNLLDTLLNTSREWNSPGLLAQALEVLLWTALILIIALLLWRYREWLATFGSRLGLPKRLPREMPNQLFGLEVAPESLPDDIASEAERLWPKQPREALGLLYRALLSRLLHDYQLTLKVSHTEGEVLQLVEQLQHDELSQFSQTLTYHWQNLAYGHLLPADKLRHSLCSGWRQLFEQRADT